ncbi:MAG: molybdopterin-dependent oxidoreductase [Candidatus Omnitrophica bacterium]|nr:molybdopterin-dependent oxidoreductase [Candidatus Omnitrophota bacterium]
MKKFTRKEFLKLSAASLGSLLLSEPLLASLKFVPEIDNPLEFYPQRDWEKIYRKQFKYDSTFHFLCAPNDTHNCLLKAYVKNGVVTRIGPSYGYGKARDIYGNQASHRWDPRLCQKGLAMVRKIYGPHRVKNPYVRKGFKDWVDAGFPRDEIGRIPSQYLNRGKEPFLKISFAEAAEMAAKAMVNIATVYSQDAGKELLRKQGYDEAMIEATQGAGTQVIKLRGGMPLLGATRIFGFYRFANSLALLDEQIRKVGKENALGCRGWDNYSWHTDLPPGHTMVCGHQTIDFDLATVENSKMVICWGMNWIVTKMPDAHWLSEARVKGTKVVTIACEYQATSNKADEVIVIRPGSDTAFALGLANVIIKEALFDTEFIKSQTDLPFLVRMDSLKLLKPEDIIKDYQPLKLNKTQVLKAGEKAPSPIKQSQQIISEELRQEWSDFVVWDQDNNQPKVLSRDDAGVSGNFALEGEFTIDAVSGQKIKVRPVFDLVKEHVAYFTPEVVSEICHADKEAVVTLAREIAQNKAQTLIAVGMGPNHFFNNDLKDRAIFLVCSLTRNIGFHAGNIGSFAGNYRGAYFNGLPFYIAEDPFDFELNSQKTPRIKYYYKMESAHYYNYEDRILRLGKKLFTGKTHIPTPTKLVWFGNSNSLLGNIKWHHDFVVNTLPKIDCVIVNEWWWTASCEYADIVFAVDSWAEFKFPDMTAAVTNPFLQIFPRTPLTRLHDTRSDIEVLAEVASALARLTGENRFLDAWKFVYENKVEVYLQRIIDNSTALKGYKIEELEKDAKQGIPALLMTRTYPKIMSWEQSHEQSPHYTRSGRLEFYRDEDEFIEHGENIPVYREPVDATFYEPNIIVCGATDLIHPKTPEDYGLSVDDSSVEARQVRNVVIHPKEVTQTVHPRKKDGFNLIYITPKYRHSVHTTPVDLDIISQWFGPFGDPYRKDKRSPWVGEGYIDINPQDAKALGIEDGDYVWVDGDPEDRPFRGWQQKPEDYKVHRLLLRARYYLGIPPGVTRSWFNMFVATYGSVEGHENNLDKLARNPRTGYQAMFRYGSHQSTTRAWLRPTLMTDSLARKEYFGQVIGKGFAPDVHCPTGAPKEGIVKITRAEPASLEGDGRWRPASLGLRPTYENSAMQKFLKGEYVK